MFSNSSLIQTCSYQRLSAQALGHSGGQSEIQSSCSVAWGYSKSACMCTCVSRCVCMCTCVWAMCVLAHVCMYVWGHIHSRVCGESREVVKQFAYDLGWAERRKKMVTSFEEWKSRNSLASKALSPQPPPWRLRKTLSNPTNEYVITCRDKSS